MLKFSVFLIVVVFVIGCRSSQGPFLVADLPVATPTPVDYERVVVKKGPVNDEETAIAIAVQAWVPVYGREQIEEERPYSAF